MTQVYPPVVVGTSMDSRIVATLQTILQKPGNLQDPGQGGIEIAQMQLQLLMTPSISSGEHKKPKRFIL